MLFSILTSGLSLSEKVFLTKLYKKEYRRMWYTAVKILNEKELAEDAVQTTFLRLLKKVSLLMTFENEKAVSKYVLVSIRNASLRMKQSSHQNISMDNIEQDFEDTAVRIETEVILQSEIETLKEQIAEMNPIFGDALYLKYFLQLEYDEIADALSISVKTARVRVFRGREILRKQKNRRDAEND